jgi:hypothetical protein
VSAVITEDLVKAIDGVITDGDMLLEDLRVLQGRTAESEPLWAVISKLRLKVAWLRSSGYKAATAINVRLDAERSPLPRVCLMDRKRLAAGEREEVER